MFVAAVMQQWSCYEKGWETDRPFPVCQRDGNVMKGAVQQLRATVFSWALKTHFLLLFCNLGLWASMNPIMYVKMNKMESVIAEGLLFPQNEEKITWSGEATGMTRTVIKVLFNMNLVTRLSLFLHVFHHHSSVLYIASLSIYYVLPVAWHVALFCILRVNMNIVIVCVFMKTHTLRKWSFWWKWSPYHMHIW